MLGDLDLSGLVAGALPPCQAVADLGCGTGALLARLRERAELAIGVDNSARMLDMAGTRLAGQAGVSLRLGELTHLPLRDGEVQAAVLSMVLHHLPEPDAALAEAARVIAPGGTLVVAELDSHEAEDMREIHGDYRLGFSVPDLTALVAGAGFTLQAHKRIAVNKGLYVLLFSSLRP